MDLDHIRIFPSKDLTQSTILLDEDHFSNIGIESDQRTLEELFKL